MSYRIVAASGAPNEPADTLVCRRGVQFFIRDTIHREYEIEPPPGVPVEQMVEFLVAKWGYLPVVEAGKPDPVCEDNEFGALGLNDQRSLYVLLARVPYDPDDPRLLPKPQVVRAS